MLRKKFSSNLLQKFKGVKFVKDGSDKHPSMLDVKFTEGSQMTIEQQLDPNIIYVHREKLSNKKKRLFKENEEYITLEDYNKRRLNKLMN